MRQDTKPRVWHGQRGKEVNSFDMEEESMKGQGRNCMSVEKSKSPRTMAEGEWGRTTQS